MLEWWRKGTKPARPKARAPVRRSVAIGGAELPLAIRTHGAARRMTLRLSPDGSEARVTLPPWGRIDEAERFARDRADWLAQQLTRVSRREPPAHGGELLYRGRRLEIVWRPQAARKPVLEGETIVVGGPEAAIAPRLRKWLESEALRLATDDLAEYCGRAGVPPPTLRLSRAARRWGSCAADRTIRINWRLVMAPDHVRRSVVAHEVAHLCHFDHSPAFHAHVGDLFEGDLAAANRWLKHEGRGLYADFG